MPTPTKKTVLYVITKSNWGGAQRYVYDLATGLSDRYNIIVAHGGTGALKDELQTAGVTTLQINSLQRDISLRQEIRAVGELRRIIKTTRPDILHINSSKAGLYGAVLGRWLRVQRIVFTAHGWAFNEERSWQSRLVFRLLHWLTVWSAHRTITVSHTLKHQLRLPWGKSKLVTVPLAITPPMYQTKHDARNALVDTDHQNDFWFGTIAELHPVKNHDTALRAFATVCQQHPHAQYVLVGAGELRDRLQTLVFELGLTHHVHFAGHVPNAAQFVTAFDCFLLPSHSEAAGYVLHEAAHAQVPIIASNVGGIPELITSPSHGTLLPPTDSTAWSTAMTTAISKPETYRTQAFNLFRTVRNTRSLNRMLADTATVYESSNKLLATTARS